MARNKHNTPGIIKYPFWRMTYQNPEDFYACVNLGEAWAPREGTIEQKIVSGCKNLLFEQTRLMILSRKSSLPKTWWQRRYCAREEVIPVDQKNCFIPCDLM